MQRLFSRATWDADDVRDYVVEHLRNDQAIPMVGETGT